MKNKILAVTVFGVTAAAAAVVGYKLASDKQLRGRIGMSVKDIFHISKKRVEEMTEEVAVKTAKMTKNPKINQDWVERQWEQLGL